MGVHASGAKDLFSLFFWINTQVCKALCRMVLLQNKLIKQHIIKKIDSYAWCPPPSPQSSPSYHHSATTTTAKPGHHRAVAFLHPPTFGRSFKASGETSGRPVGAVEDGSVGVRPVPGALPPPVAAEADPRLPRPRPLIPSGADHSPSGNRG